MDRRSFLGAVCGLAACGQVHAGPPPRRVLVIGAGLSGLSAARELVKAGAEVELVEARDRIGGRVWTSRQWQDAPVDLGACWIHGVNGNPLTALAREAKIVTRPSGRGDDVIFGPDGAPLPPQGQRRLSAFRKRIRSIVEEAQEEDPDRSLRTAVREGWGDEPLGPFEKQLLEFALSGEYEHEYAGSADALSVQWFDSGEEFEGGDHLFPQGFQAVAEHLAKGLTIRLGEPVRSIDWSGATVRVVSSQRTYEADRAIVTIPLGVLKAGGVRFEPALPTRKLAAIDKLGMGLLNKCILRFPKAFWPKRSEWIEQVAPELQTWSEWVNLQPLTDRPILMGFEAAAQAVALEKRKDDQIVADAMTTLRRLFGDIPAPEGVQITRWGADPYAGGSYSFHAVGNTPRLRADLREPLAGKVFFAGEATSKESFGTAHGAVLSGRAAARAALG